jgi:hypothetical protein
MPPRLPIVDPVPLEALLDMFEHHKDQDVEALGSAVLYLSSVTNDLAVKEAISRRPNALRGIALMLLQPAFFQIQYELIMILAELCRHEDAKEVSTKPDLLASINRTNNLARNTCCFLATLPWLHEAIQGVVTHSGKARDGGHAARAAEDLLAALPAKSATPEEALAAWTPAAIAKCLDLMFLDERYRLLEYSPFVVRASPWTCGCCGKRSETAAANEAAKKPRGQQYSRCASCKAIFYCSPDCQKAHWKEAHKPACQAIKKGLTEGFKRVDGSAEAFTSLYYSNRAFIYLQRPEVLQGVDFDDFFLKYTAGSA